MRGLCFAFFILPAACGFDPNLPAISCGADGFCPIGFVCNSENQCVKPRGNNDGDMPARDGGTSPGVDADRSTPLEATCSRDNILICDENSAYMLAFQDDAINGYSCSTLNTIAADRIHAFEAPRSGSVVAELTVSDPTEDWNLYVLAGVCNAEACVAKGEASGDDSVSFLVSAGTTYYLVVEANVVASPTSLGRYRLEVSCP